MINLDTINKEILELEQHDTTYATCEKLAWLYIVRDHMKELSAQESVKTGRASEFCQACAEHSISDVMDILDEHMNAVGILYPKEYATVIRKINELSLPK